MKDDCKFDENGRVKDIRRLDLGRERTVRTRSYEKRIGYDRCQMIVTFATPKYKIGWIYPLKHTAKVIPRGGRRCISLISAITRIRTT